MGLGELFDPRAFALGMLGLVNPCGFALLPAYLGFFMGTDQDRASENRLIALNRAQVVALSMSAGFLAVFGILGLALAGILNEIVGYLPWVTVGLGLFLTALGVAMVFGFQPLLPLPKLEKGGGSRSAASMFLFGVSYALASLTCTIGVFLSAVGTSASGATYGQRFGSFLSYGVGMGLLATTLTLAVAFGRKGVVGRVRRLLPHVNRISAAILIVVGLYLAWYGYWSTDPIGIAPGPITRVEGIQASLQVWIRARTAVLGWGFLALNLALAGAGFLARRNSGPAPRPSSSGAGARSADAPTTP